MLSIIKFLGYFILSFFIMSVKINNRTVFSHMTKNSNSLFSELKVSMASMTEYSIPAPKAAVDFLKTKQSAIKNQKSLKDSPQAHDEYDHSDKENLNKAIQEN